MKKIIFACDSEGFVEIFPEETQRLILERYKTEYNLTDDQLADYGLSEYEDADEAELSARPPEEILASIADDMEIIGAFIDEDEAGISFYSDVVGTGCGFSVAELMERLGFEVETDSGTGRTVVYDD